MPRRYKIRFPNLESYSAAQQATEFEGPEAMFRSAKGHVVGQSLVHVRNDKRHYISIEPSSLLAEGESEKKFEMQVETFDKEFGARIVEDFRYDMENDIFATSAFGPDDPADPTLDDVLDLIDAPAAWQDSRGQGITIAVVDTGIDGSRPEFPMSKRAGSWQAITDTPWTDWKGHGTMCACIAAGTKASGGRFNGVAPDADIIACKTRFYDSELADIYDYLIDLVRNGGRNIVATNSFGIQTGTPPPIPEDSDFMPALQDAIDIGIKVFFSAGNYHEDANGLPDRCDPTSIWLHKCKSDVMTVATCDMDRNMWYYSSRGPGQFAGQAGHSDKPDVTAATPKNGRVVYGNVVRSLPNGWGTSGACPQAAGLAALLLGKDPGLTRQQLFDIIRKSTTSLPHSAACAGTGLINCKQAIDAV